MLPDGTDYASINPKGYVPALKLDNGQVLTEVGVVLQYIADQKPGSGLAPAAGTMERYRLMEMLNFITSELHKNFTPLFNPAASAEAKQTASTNITKRMAYLNDQLAGKQYLLGDTYTVADAYLFTVAQLEQAHVGVDLSPLSASAGLRDARAARPAVQAAMKAEGSNT